MNGNQYQPRGWQPQGGGQYQNNQQGGQQGGYRNNDQGTVPRERPPLPEPVFYRPFAVTSNRDVPDSIKNRAIELTRTLVNKGHTARVGVLDGLEAMVNSAVTQNTECHIPFRGFAQSESKFNFSTPECLAIARHFATGFDQLKPAIQSFMGKNVRLILGNKNQSLIQFLVCYTEDGAESTKEVTSRTGICGHAIKVADYYNIPVFNLKHPDCESRIMTMFGHDDKSRPMQITQDDLPD